MFTGIVSEGQVLDKGWSKLDSGQIDEIRTLQDFKTRVSVGNPENEYLFMCSRVYEKISEGDDVKVQ